ncbi:MAG: hypothetical protein KDA84_09080 [Planctomycetaceae bacterium]|nr:hypothetical protein [Planctomycetaceae bacterium]
MTKKQRKPKRHKLASRKRIETSRPKLRFSPTAWAKLLFLRDYGETEIGGFGISHPEDLLLVEDVQLVKQTCSWAHVAFDDESVADFFDQQVDCQRVPEQFARIWVHTHPGDCPLPSLTDEDTFERVFGRASWALMFILAQSGETYARLRLNVGPRAEIEIAVDRDYTSPFPASNSDAWEQKYLTQVSPQSFQGTHPADWEMMTAVSLEEELMGEDFESWLEEQGYERGGVE